ncbi:hypothetical protein ACOSP7_032742 [Xanthoceras sorbifolium]
MHATLQPIASIAILCESTSSGLIGKIASSRNMSCDVVKSGTKGKEHVYERETLEGDIKSIESSEKKLLGRDELGDPMM